MTWWVRDDEGRVFGPAKLLVVQDLLSRGRLRGVTDASRDGILWSKASGFAELAPHLTPTSAPSDEPRAKELQALLASWRGKPAHEVFSTPVDADADTIRRAYLAMVKDFHPARLPADASVRLRAASVAVFQFLGGLMESAQATAPRATPPALRRVASTPPASRPPASNSAPAWSLEEFVGFDRRADDKLEMRVVVDRARAGMFTQHPLMNLAQGAMFVPTPTPPGLGTPLELVLVVGEPAREVHASGRVVWACAPGGRGQPGVGVSFTRLEPADRRFLDSFVRSAASVKTGPR